MPKFKGEILVDRPWFIVFRAQGKTVKLPKTGITRLEPNDYNLGPHTVYLSGRLAEKKFGTTRGRSQEARAPQMDADA